MVCLYEAREVIALSIPIEQAIVEGFLSDASGGLLTVLYVFWMTSRLFQDHHFQRAIMFYGASTGTLPTGLALLRIADPEFLAAVAAASEVDLAFDLHAACSLTVVVSALSPVGRKVNAIVPSGPS